MPDNITLAEARQIAREMSDEDRKRLSDFTEAETRRINGVAGHCAVLTGSLAGMTDAEATDALWDALRLECCSTGLKAHRIIMLNKHDIAAALKRLTPENSEDDTRPRHP